MVGEDHTGRGRVQVTKQDAEGTGEGRRESE